MIIRTKTYSRIGFMGNPSDIFFGKTISFCITNFCAEVTLWESPTLQIIPNKISDPTEFSSLSDLHDIVTRDGYYGGIRLIYATCKKFREHCEKNKIKLPRKNFTVMYDSNIPRQVGLGGSSAISTALIKSLMKFYGLTDEDIPKPILPNLLLSVEREELGIPAGLQDRVVQSYGGTVYMDFSENLMLEQGHGNYEFLDPNLMPNLFLAFIADPGDSGKIHSDVQFRYEQGDTEVIEAMRTFAGYAEQAKEALMKRDFDAVAKLMDMNFDLRRKIYGDRVIGEKNLEMVAIARKLGSPAKFSGSGGAIIGMYENWNDLQEIGQIYRERGFGFAKISLDPGY